jgi:hypothetical protein
MGISMTNRSTFRLFDIALRSRQRARVLMLVEESLLWNLIWPIADAPDGNFYFDDQPNMLNQFLVDENLATGDARKLDRSTVQIFRLPAMVNPGI